MIAIKSIAGGAFLIGLVPLLFRIAVDDAFGRHAGHSPTRAAPRRCFFITHPCLSLESPHAPTELIGYLAATLTTCSFVPQAWHTFRTRDVSGISLGMYSVFTTGVALWLVYGIALQAWPIVVANAITLLLASTILGMKLRFRRAPGG